MSKGSSVRPTNKIAYDTNYERIFGNKYNKNMEDYWEKCPYCGIKAESVCDSPPPDYCEKAINITYGSPAQS